MILRECAGSGEQPWYPAAYSQATGVPRDALDAAVDELRLGGLIRLTDWVQGRGQGYVLTSEGKEVVESPRLLNRLRVQGVPARAVPPVATQAIRGDGQFTAWDRGEEVRAALLGPATPQVTLVVLFLNLLVFAYGCALAVRSQVRLTDFVEGSSPAVLVILRATGALMRDDIVVANQWWRLISCCFVHFGFLHLAVNMYSLYVVGPLLERMWGKWRFLLLYLIAGLVGSCSMMLFSSPNFLGAGASGALWGIMASMATWVFLNRSHLPSQLVAAWKRQLLIVFVLNVLITYGIPSISAAAHFGGGIAGLVVAVPLQYVRPGHGWQRWIAVAGVAMVPLASLAAVEYTIAPDREQEQAEVKYLPVVRKVFHAEVKVFRVYVKPLILKPVPERREDAEAKQAREAANDLQKRMKETADFLASAGPFRDPAVAEAMQAAHDYLEAASRFYESFKRSLDPDVRNWTDQDEQMLGQHYTQLITRRKDFEDQGMSFEELNRQRRPGT